MKYIIIAVLTGGAGLGLSALFARKKPYRINGDAGEIRPMKWVVAFGAGFGLLLLLGGIYSIVTGPTDAVLILAIGMGTAIFFGMAPSLTRAHDIVWDESGITGPSKVILIAQGFSRTQISWGDICGAGKTASSFWYVETRDGRRIYWNYIYAGYGAFVAVLGQRCPDLELPQDL